MKTTHKVILILFLFFSVLCKAAPIVTLKEVRSLYGVTLIELEKRYKSTKFRRAAHDPETYDHYVSVESYNGIWFKVNGSKVELVELLSDVPGLNLPYKIGERYCSVTNKNSDMYFDVTYDDRMWVYLIDSKLNIKLWFNAESYIDLISGDKEMIKNNIELCTMNLTKIEILKG